MQTFRTFTGAQGQEINEGHLEELCLEIVHDIQSSNNVVPTNLRPYLAWRLAKEFFSIAEMINKNCNGKKCKEPLDTFKLGLIKKLCFEHFPKQRLEDKRRLWLNCTKKIDSGIRNLRRYHKMNPSMAE